MKELEQVAADVLAFVRTRDPDAGAELAELRRRQVTRPSVVLVGETKRGKSSLVNALLGVPGLSPVRSPICPVGTRCRPPIWPSGPPARSRPGGSR
jgi:ribosome biogenesis GTPase A